MWNLSRKNVTVAAALVAVWAAGCGETSASGADAGVDAGRSDAGWSDAGMVDAGMVDAGMQDAGVPCSTSKPQPDTCGYGGACYTDMKCGAVANDVACVNIAKAITKGNYAAWNATSTGPIIYVHVDEADVAADCEGNTTPFTVSLYAYAGTALFPTTKSGLPGFWYFDAEGNRTDIALALLRPSNYTVSTDRKNMNAKFTLCAAADSTALAAGFGFTGGNAYCASLTR